MAFAITFAVFAICGLVVAIIGVRSLAGRFAFTLGAAFLGFFSATVVVNALLTDTVHVFLKRAGLVTMVENPGTFWLSILAWAFTSVAFLSAIVFLWRKPNLRHNADTRHEPPRAG
jgi:hypothetical protein